MAKLHILNCVPDALSVALNYEPAPRSLERRPADAQGEVLPTITLDIAEDAMPEQGRFALAAVNTLSVRFATIGTPATYDVGLEPEARGRDVFLFVFANTLVGQTEAGTASGVSISAHELVRKIIQDGSPPQVLRFPGSDADIAEILRNIPLDQGDE